MANTRQSTVVSTLSRSDRVGDGAEFGVDIDDETEGDHSAEVVTFVFLQVARCDALPLARTTWLTDRRSRWGSNKAALWAQLLQSRVVTSSATFDEFVETFTSSANSSFVDIARSKVENKISGMLTIHGPQPALKRVYIAGVHPTSCQ